MCRKAGLWLAEGIASLHHTDQSRSNADVGARVLPAATALLPLQLLPCPLNCDWDKAGGEPKPRKPHVTWYVSHEKTKATLFFKPLVTLTCVNYWNHENRVIPVRKTTQNNPNTDLKKKKSLKNLTRVRRTGLAAPPPLLWQRWFWQRSSSTLIGPQYCAIMSFAKEVPRGKASESERVRVVGMRWLK